MTEARLHERPPVQQHSFSGSYMATRPFRGESLYEWATTDYFQMEKKMWINPDVSIDHTLKVVPDIKNFRILAKVSEVNCDSCRRINCTRPLGAPKIPCIISDARKNRCALCIVLKKPHNDCRVDELRAKSKDCQGFERNHPEQSIHGPTQARTRERSLQVDCDVGRERDRQKRARLSLGPSLHNDNEENFISLDSTTTFFPETNTSMDEVNTSSKPTDQEISRHIREGTQSLLLTSKRMVEEMQQQVSGESGQSPPSTNRSATPHTQRSNRGSRNGGEVDQLQAEALNASSVQMTSNSNWDDSTVVGDHTSRRESICSSRPLRYEPAPVSPATTRVESPPVNSAEGPPDLFKPLVERFTQNRQEIARLRASLEEEKKKNEETQQKIKAAEEVKQNFVALKEDYRLVKAEKDRLICENQILRERNLEFEKMVDKCYKFLMGDGVLKN